MMGRHLLEEEVVLDELVLHLLAHTLEWVEGTLEITLESVQSGYDFLHDLDSLLASDAWSEWEVSQVSADSNSGADDKSSIFSVEGRGLQLGCVHIRYVLSTLAMLVIIQDHSVEKRSECGV